jgi:hypothetical protein
MMEIWGETMTIENVEDKWHIKLNRVNFFLKGWGVNSKGQTRRYKMILQQELGALEKKEEEGMLAS